MQGCCVGASDVVGGVTAFQELLVFTFLYKEKN